MRRILPSTLCIFVLFASACGGGTASDPGTGVGDLPSANDSILPDVLTDDQARDEASSDSLVADAPFSDPDVLLIDDLPVVDSPALPGCPPCGKGTVSGLACAPDGQTVVPDVGVTIDGIDCHGQAFHITTTSDSFGRYTVENVPCGYRVVQLAKGSFSHQFDVFVAADQVTETKNGRCFEGSAARIAVITGEWDRLEDILTTLKLQYTSINGVQSESGGSAEAESFLSDWNRLSKFNVLFINCGRSQYTGSAAVANLRKFVEGGGSIYGSDYAVNYMAVVWPEALILPADPYSVYTQTVNADIRDPRLFGYLQKMTVTIQYGLSPLVMVDEPGIGTETHIEGIFPKYEADQNIHPQLMSFQPYGTTGGRVIYGNFHHDEQVKEPGKTDVRNILKYIVFSL